MNRVLDLSYDKIFKFKYDFAVKFNQKAVANLRLYTFAIDIWNMIRQ